jgi:hypothetical protein
VLAALQLVLRLERNSRRAPSSFCVLDPPRLSRPVARESGGRLGSISG